jgi:hypothetical protein
MNCDGRIDVGRAHSTLVVGIEHTAALEWRLSGCTLFCGLPLTDITNVTFDIMPFRRFPFCVNHILKTNIARLLYPCTTSQVAYN